jgi:membrane-bound lytic murein transglycosylase F
MVRVGQAHMAAAGLTITNQRQRSLAFSQPYQTVTHQLVYRRGQKRPKDLGDIAKGRLRVVAQSSHVANLQALRGSNFPSLTWTATNSLDIYQLLDHVDQGILDFTVADSNELAVFRRYLVSVLPAFDIGQPQSLGWAFAKWPDRSLVDAADRFLAKIRQNGSLRSLIEQQRNRFKEFSFVDKRTFWRNVETRLPKYRPYFEQASVLVDLDWRLLAAMGYQESHWNPKAVSPTGVRGIMMLTRDTAKQLGVKDRTDPKASILGGARYLRIIESKLPHSIRKPDRLWLALAGYNVGFGHLEDARILTERQGGDPERWEDVKLHLPLLAKEKYYKTLKHGYARGAQPVAYVENVRSYYDMLLWEANQARTIVVTTSATPKGG